MKIQIEDKVFLNKTKRKDILNLKKRFHKSFLSIRKPVNLN
jgi:hypothetical protein